MIDSTCFCGGARFCSRSGKLGRTIAQANCKSKAGVEQALTAARISSAHFQPKNSMVTVPMPRNTTLALFLAAPRHPADSHTLSQKKKSSKYADKSGIRTFSTVRTDTSHYWN